MQRWMNARRHELVTALVRDDEFTGRAKDWAKLDIGQRAALLKDLIRRQTHIYSRSAIDFAAPRVNIVAPGAAARHGGDCWVDVPRIEKIESPNDMTLNIREDFLRDASAAQALMLAQHETVHHLTAQLALAVYDGKIGPRHPLHEDAANRLARMQNHCNASSAIGSAYESDGEETLAYDQCIRFGEEFFAGGQRSLKDRFLAALDRAFAASETQPAQKPKASAPMMQVSL
jgi:hypothetical protein